jgi:glycosyltransferase involved in cell wall biosynthesis
MNNISGIILTKNNQRTISDCIRAIKPIITELIIIDDYSEDKTLDIIKQEYPEVKIYQKKLVRFDEQRNHGINLAENNWILMIDSDEIISIKLQKSIKAESELKETDAYWVERLNRFFSVYLKENYTNRPILFRKTLKFIFPVHEIIEIDKTRTKKLAGELKHESWQSIEKNMEKMNAYSTLIAEKWIEQKRNYGNFKLFILALILPPRYFFICYFKKGFYRAGFFNGFFYSLFESSWWLAVVFKYRELKFKKD